MESRCLECECIAGIEGETSICCTEDSGEFSQLAQHSLCCEVPAHGHWKLEPNYCKCSVGYSQRLHEDDFFDICAHALPVTQVVCWAYNQMMPSTLASQYVNDGVNYCTGSMEGLHG